MKFILGVQMGKSLQFISHRFTNAQQIKNFCQVYVNNSKRMFTTKRPTFKDDPFVLDTKPRSAGSFRKVAPSQDANQGSVPSQQPTAKSGPIQAQEQAIKAAQSERDTLKRLNPEKVKGEPTIPPSRASEAKKEPAVPVNVANTSQPVITPPSAGKGTTPSTLSASTTKTQDKAPPKKKGGFSKLIFAALILGGVAYTFKPDGLIANLPISSQGGASNANNFLQGLQSGISTLKPYFQSFAEKVPVVANSIKDRFSTKQVEPQQPMFVTQMPDGGFNPKPAKPITREVEAEIMSNDYFASQHEEHRLQEEARQKQQQEAEDELAAKQRLDAQQRQQQKEDEMQRIVEEQRLQLERERVEYEEAQKQREQEMIEAAEEEANRIKQLQAEEAERTAHEQWIALQEAASLPADVEDSTPLPVVTDSQGENVISENDDDSIPVEAQDHVEVNDTIDDIVQISSSDATPHQSESVHHQLPEESLVSEEDNAPSDTNHQEPVPEQDDSLNTTTTSPESDSEQDDISPESRPPQTLQDTPNEEEVQTNHVNNDTSPQDIEVIIHPSSSDSDSDKTGDDISLPPELEEKLGKITSIITSRSARLEWEAAQGEAAEEGHRILTQAEDEMGKLVQGIRTRLATYETERTEYLDELRYQLINGSIGSERLVLLLEKKDEEFFQECNNMITSYARAALNAAVGSSKIANAQQASAYAQKLEVEVKRMHDALEESFTLRLNQQMDILREKIAMEYDQHIFRLSAENQRIVDTITDKYGQVLDDMSSRMIKLTRAVDYHTKHREQLELIQRLTVALVEAERLLGRGESLLEPWHELQEVAQHDPVLKNLLNSIPRHVVVDGVAPVYHLQKAFLEVEKEAHASAFLPPRTSFVSHLLSKVFGTFTIKTHQLVAIPEFNTDVVQAYPSSISNEVINDSFFTFLEHDQARLSRAGFYIDRGHIASALDELIAIRNPHVKTVCQPLIVQAKDRIALDQTLQVIRAHSHALHHDLEHAQPNDVKNPAQ